MKRINLLVILLLIFTSATFAAEPPGFNIIVKNDTPFTCELIYAYPIVGHDPHTLIQSTLAKGDQTTFQIPGFLRHEHKRTWDKNYVLSYQCGNQEVGYKKITFSSQLYPGIFYGTPSGEILTDLTDSGITAIIEDITHAVNIFIPLGDLSDSIYSSGEIRWSIKY